MSKPKIDNEAPLSLYFKRDEFYFIQCNYPTINEIVFSDHPTRGILSRNSNYVVAVFKVTPRQQLVITEAGELEAYETMFR